MSRFLSLAVSAAVVSLTYSHDPLLKEIATLYSAEAFKDDVTSIAVDGGHLKLYSANTVSGTIDIVPLDAVSSEASDDGQAGSLQIERTIDIKEESSPYFALDYMTSIAYSPSGYMVASLIPLNYAQSTGWLAFIDTETEYISHFIRLEECFSPKHVVATADGRRLVVACEGLADDDIADPAGSISVVDTSSDDASAWKVFSVGFSEFDDCDGSPRKHLPQGIYRPRPESPFSVNAEPEFVALDDVGHYAYISLQENNAVAILDLVRLEMESVHSFGAHDFGFSGLDASDLDGKVHIERFPNLFGLRQPDGVAHHRSSGGNQYLLTANEGNAKYYDAVRVGDADLDADAFGYCEEIQDDEHLGRLFVLSGAGDEYGQNEYGEFEALYTFGSRDWTAWQIQAGGQPQCPCDYPSALQLVFSSLDDLEQITAHHLGLEGFNSDLFAPSGDGRSDDKGPEPESIAVGQCSNGDSYAFIGLERAGGVMVYDITDIDDGDVTFVEYLNPRDFSVEYEEGSRPPESAGDVEPETMVFVPDSDDSEQALLVVGYKTSASIAVYSFDCGCHRQYDHDALDDVHHGDDEDTGFGATEDAHFDTADECSEQSPCLHVAVEQMVALSNHSHGGTAARRLGHDDEEEVVFRVCLSMDLANPYCTKKDDHFLYAASLHEEEVQDAEALALWSDGTTRCQMAHCSETVSFAVRDGEGCSASSSLLSQTLGAVDGVECHPSGQDSCHWTVPTPQCAAGDYTVGTGPVTVELEVEDGLEIELDAETETGDSSTCSGQADCVHFEVTADGEDAEEIYLICAHWQGDDGQCAKDATDVFAESAVGTHSEDLTMGWQSGGDHSICKVVGCGTHAVFGIKDGDSCADSDDFSGAVDALEGVTCSGADGGYAIEGSCKWTVPAPECLLMVVEDTGSDFADDNDFQMDNDEQQEDNAWHTITNRGGHFYESTVFFVLLAISVLTCISVVGCVVKLSRGTHKYPPSPSIDLQEEPLEPGDWDPEHIEE